MTPNTSVGLSRSATGCRAAASAVCMSVILEQRSSSPTVCCVAHACQADVDRRGTVRLHVASCCMSSRGALADALPDGIHNRLLVDHRPLVRRRSHSKSHAWERAARMPRPCEATAAHGSPQCMRATLLSPLKAEDRLAALLSGIRVSSPGPGLQAAVIPRDWRHIQGSGSGTGSGQVPAEKQYHHAGSAPV